MKSTVSDSTILMKQGDPARSFVHTIKTDKNFTSQTRFKHFYTEAPCVEYIKTQKNLHLFGEDVSSDMRKQFYAINYNTIYLLSQTKKFHLYEYFNDTEPLKLFLDIDIAPKNIPEHADKQALFDEIIGDSIKLVTDILEIDHNIIKTPIIILKSSSDIKLSAHIIFPSIVFKSIKEMKFFMFDIKSPLIDKGIIDPLVYKKGAFRCIWNSKCGKYITLEYYQSHNYVYKNEESLFLDCLVKNINNDNHKINVIIPENVNITKNINKIQQNHNKILQINNGKKNNEIVKTGTNKISTHSVSSLKPYLQILDLKRADTYKTWLDIGMILHNCNPSEECFTIWNEWSKQSSSYSSRDCNAYKWSSFKLGFFSIASLKFFAKQDNPDLYPDIGSTLEEPSFIPHDFSSEYLLGDKIENINDNKSFVSQHIIDWMTTDTYKSLAIKSCYNSGKTDIIKKIITEFNPQKILFISYRQTLTHELHGNFKDLGVRSYLNGSYDADRLICQIESLHNLSPEINGDLLLIPSYDLVIIDEIESILNHFLSSTIPDKLGVFGLMKDIIFNSNKVLALDGDFHNRSYSYLSNFGKVNILNNQVKKDKRNYIFTNSKLDIENDISEKLKEGKNIVIVSMSSKLATYFYNKYSNTYKTILHCSKSDDKNKLMLKNIVEFWKGFQLVIYSPSIEAGCNFDAPHFHKIYMILSPKSTSPRGLMQMGSRVRKIEDPNIMVFLNNLPFRSKANFYSYSEIKEYVCDLYQTFLIPERKLNTILNKVVIEYNFDLYTQILIHNECEKANKSNNLFVPYLIQLLSMKGHTFQYVNTRPNQKSYNKDNLLKDEILNAKDIDSEMYDNLFDKLCSNNASREDKVMVERYIIKQDWKVTEITDPFLINFYGKTPMLFNLRFLLNNNLIEPYSANRRDKYNIIFDKVTKLEQIKMINEVITDLGFDILTIHKTVNKETFLINMKKVIDESQIFNNISKSHPLFEFDKTKIGKIITVKQFMGFINTLFLDWGLKIKIKRKIMSTRIDGKKISTSIPFYFLNYIKNIDSYV